MSQASAQNHARVLSQLNECMKSCREAYLEALECQIPDARARMEPLYSSLIDMQQDFKIYADIMESSNDQNFDEILAVVENTKRAQEWDLIANKRTLMAETFDVSVAPAGEDDDDVTFEGEDAMTGLTCSVTGKLPTNPVVSRICRHVFEKDAILSFIQKYGTNGQIQCPKAGCSANFGKGDLEVSKEICNKIRKAMKSQKNEWEQLE